MPRIIADGKRITAVWSEWHLFPVRQCAVKQRAFVENGADMRGRAVGRQIKLDRHALPAAVRVRPFEISRNVACQDRKRIHSDLGKGLSKAALQSGLQSL